AVDSAPGAGATFSFTIPLAPAAPASAAPFTPPRLEGRSILIVAASDHPVEAALVARRLADWGARTRVVPNDVGLVESAQQSCDPLIVDGAIGLVAAQTIAQTAPATRRVLLATPNQRHELGAHGAAGFTGYLTKPVRAASLAARFAADAHASEGREDSTDVAPHAPSTAASAMTILVAEDNEINALLTRSLLAKLGHRPTVAATGAEAVEAWRVARAAGTPYDLVLMDVHMPDMDGVEAARRIRAAEQGDNSRTPI